MKTSELKPCAACGKGVMHGGVATFYILTVGHRVVDVPAAQRAVGLEMAHGRLAAILGPDETIAHELGNDVRAIICFHCAMSKPLAEIWESISGDEGGDGP